MLLQCALLALAGPKKYIMRSDLMFKRITAAASTVTEKDDAALRIIAEAEVLESEGKCVEAAELYRKAFKLSPTIAAHFNS